MSHEIISRESFDASPQRRNEGTAEGECEIHMKTPEPRSR